MVMPTGGIISKSFFERREGWTGSAILAAIVAAGLSFFYLFGGAVVTALENLVITLALMIAGVI